MSGPRLFAGLLVLAVLVLLFRGPSADAIVRNTTIAPEAGWIQFKDVRFEAEWGDQVSYRGYARLFERARYKSAPFFTHHTMLSTGDYAVAKRVQMRHNGGGSFSWSAQVEPEGTVVALHIVPRDDRVLRQLKRIDDGDLVELVGRVELDGHVKGSDGSYHRLGRSNHKYLLVESATRLTS